MGVSLTACVGSLHRLPAAARLPIVFAGGMAANKVVAAQLEKNI